MKSISDSNHALQRTTTQSLNALRLLAYAADKMAYQDYSKLLSRRVGPYLVIRVMIKYARIGQDVIGNTISINPLPRNAKEARSNLGTTSNSRANTNTNFAKEVSTEQENISYAVEEIIGRKGQPTGKYYAVQWYGYRLRDDTVKPT